MTRKKVFRKISSEKLKLGLQFGIQRDRFEVVAEKSCLTRQQVHVSCNDTKQMNMTNTQDSNQGIPRKI